MTNPPPKKKQNNSHIWETPNLSTDADSSTDIFVSAGVKKGLIAFFLPEGVMSILPDFFSHLP